MKTLSLDGFLREIGSGSHLFPKHFSTFVTNQAPGLTKNDARLLQALTALLLYQQSRGHVCLHMEGPVVYQKEDAFLTLDLPPHGDIIDAFKRMPDRLIAEVSTGIPAPLVYSTGPRPLLYLYRYCHYEKTLQERLLDLVQFRQQAPLSGKVMDALPETGQDVSEKQRVAMENALSRTFSIIAGGPGTGKTTIAVNIIAAKLLREPGLRIALAAPTGKAANRMEEAFRGMVAAGRLPMPDSIPEKVNALKASTLNRLLGSEFNSPYFRHNRDNPLPHDFVLVDEASMIDLPMMAKLFDAIGPETGMVLIGDPYQLPSVEVGSIFGDMVNADAIKPVVTTLSENFRAREAQDIVALCERIKQGSSCREATMQLLRNPPSRERPGGPQVKWESMEDPSRIPQIVNTAVKRYQDIFKDTRSILTTHTRFRILTALKNGPFGSSSINRQIKNRLDSPHELIMVTKNDPETNLFNGDTGVLIHSGKGVYAHFSDDGKPVSALRLPEYVPAYAMTGHKAQGSEFDEVHIVLPADPNCPLLNREWLYTAVSRARKQVVIWGSESALTTCLSVHVQRRSGLFQD